MAVVKRKSGRLFNFSRNEGTLLYGLLEMRDLPDEMRPSTLIILYWSTNDLARTSEWLDET